MNFIHNLFLSTDFVRVTGYHSEVFFPSLFGLGLPLFLLVCPGHPNCKFEALVKQRMPQSLI